MIRSGMPKQWTERTVHDGDGKERWIHTDKVPVCDKDGKVIGLIVMIQDITKRKQHEAEREKLILDLQRALAEVKTLSGMLPICATCKKIRDDQGYWQKLENFVRAHSGAEFSHSICPDCMRLLYPQFASQVTGGGTEPPH